MLITGLRGVGKTVLLNTFEAIAEEAGFRTAKSEITHETEFRPLIARLTRRALLAVSPAKRMKERARRAAAVFKAFTLRTPEGLEIGVDVEAMLGRADSGDPATTSPISSSRSARRPPNTRPASSFCSTRCSSSTAPSWKP